MKTKIFSKKLLVILSLVLIAVTALTIAGCSDKTKGSEMEPPTVSQADSVEVTLLGEGEKSFFFTVTDSEGKETSFKIKTDKATVGEALFEEGLIAGDESKYGLLVKTVCGITLDYDKDQKFWAFYENGVKVSAGVDSTEIKEGATYSLKAEKWN